MGESCKIVDWSVLGTRRQNGEKYSGITVDWASCNLSCMPASVGHVARCPEKMDAGGGNSRSVT